MNNKNIEDIKNYINEILNDDIMRKFNINNYSNEILDQFKINLLDEILGPPYHAEYGICFSDFSEEERFILATMIYSYKK